MTFYTHYPSPIGTLLLTSDGSSLTGITFGTPDPHWIRMETLSIFDSAKGWLEGYFGGKPTAVDFPISPAGTPFQYRVWALLKSIPYGETVTYGDLAKRLGETMSAQAVGQAVGRNPIAIVIPCHRVIGARGQLIGYAWGIEKKQWLLTHEEETK